MRLPMNFSVVNLSLWRSGGYGDLYIGRRTDTGKSVVVKFLRDYQHPHARKAFERQVLILAAAPRGFVPLLGCDTDAEIPYYVMPFFPGGSLTGYAANLSDYQLLGIATELARWLPSMIGGALMEMSSRTTYSCLRRGSCWLQILWETVWAAQDSSH
jgi:hypothetical protein